MLTPDSQRLADAANIEARTKRLAELVSTAMCASERQIVVYSGPEHTETAAACSVCTELIGLGWKASYTYYNTHVPMLKVEWREP